MDLEKFGLEDVRVCSACFGVVGVLTHGQSLMVNKTKVNQKLKEGKKTKGGAKVKELPMPAPTASTTTPKVSARAPTKNPLPLAAPTPTRPSSSASSVTTPASVPSSSVDPTIVSGTPRVKRMKSTVPVSAGSASAASPTASAPVVRTALVVNPNGSVVPVVSAASSSSPAGRVSQGGSPNPPLAIMAPAIPALTYNPSPSSHHAAPAVTAAMSAPVQKAVSVSAVSGSTVVMEQSDAALPVKKKVVKKIVKKVKPVPLAPSQ